MSMPNIPNIKPEINVDREKSIDLLIASVALQELALSHVVNAEAEKIQFVLGTLDKDYKKECPTIDELLEINKSVQQTLKLVIKKEIVLEFLLDEALDVKEENKKDDEDDEDDEEEHGHG